MRMLHQYSAGLLQQCMRKKGQISVFSNFVNYVEKELMLFAKLKRPYQRDHRIYLTKLLHMSLLSKQRGLRKIRVVSLLRHWLTV